MSVNIIAAVAANGAIGRDNSLMWHLRDDMLFFKSTTSGHPVIMGRKTFESLGKPLPGRLNIVITRNASNIAGDWAEAPVIVSSLDRAIELATEHDKECFIIGGGQIYAEGIQLADSIYLTRVFLSPEDADSFFPDIDATQWLLSDRGEIQTDKNNGIEFRFEKYTRRK